MNSIIIYGSHYGTARAYAEKFAEMTGFDVVSYEKIKDLAGYGRVIHFGGLYAGGVKGLMKTLRALPADARLVIVTVGLADVSKTQNTDHIRKDIAMRVPGEVMARTEIVHLRGGMDYSKLNFAHRTMMSMVLKKVEKIPEDQRSDEDRDMLETYGKTVSFVDFSTLSRVMDAMGES